MRVAFTALQGRTLVSIHVSNDEIRFVADDGRMWRSYHAQDCCEDVSVDEVIGDTTDLLGTPILLAEERASSEPDAGPAKAHVESCTWTFYELRTIKGSVTIRWFGESNGYYSESVDFEELQRYDTNDADTWMVAGDRVLELGLVDADGVPELDAQYRTYFALGGK